MEVNHIRHSLASSLSKAQILITGASGFVGHSLLRQLEFLQSRHDVKFSVTAQIRSGSVSLFSSVVDEMIVADFGQELPIVHSPDIIFHCATPASAILNIARPREMFDLNICAMDWILNNPLLIKKCPVVVFTSSGAVYGEQPKDLSHIPEGWNAAPDPLSVGIAYAEGKRVAEFLLSEAGRQGLVRPVIARLFAFSGIGLPLDRHYAIGNFVYDAITKQEIVIRGDGKTIRSYLDSEDMAIWLLRAATTAQPNFPLHIGSMKAITMYELANTVQCGIELGHNQEYQLILYALKTQMYWYGVGHPSCTVISTGLLHLVIQPRLGQLMDTH